MTVPVSEALNDGWFTAATELLRRTGSTQFQIRFDDDEKPVVWYAVVLYERAKNAEGEIPWETAAGHNPVEAVLRLAEQVLTGGTCAHCRKPAGFEENPDIVPPAPDQICWYQYDPEAKTFRRGCESEEQAR